jgi:hypothetical protein
LCGDELDPDELVIEAVPLTDVTSLASKVRPEYVEGRPGFFHAYHWYGDSGHWAERGRGPVRSFIED